MLFSLQVTFSNTFVIGLTFPKNSWHYKGLHQKGQFENEGKWYTQISGLHNNNSIRSNKISTFYLWECKEHSAKIRILDPNELIFILDSAATYAHE